MIKLLFLLGLFLILSEKISLESILIGTFAAIGVYILNLKHRMEIPDRVWSVNGLKIMLLYLKVLICEIVLANIEVAKVVLNPNKTISPCIFQFKTQLKSDFAKTILSNSITLTPGTITVSADGDIFTVHSLKEDYVQGVINSKFEKMLLKIEE